MVLEPSRSLPASQGPPSRGATPLLRTFPGRAIVAGVAVKLLIAALRLGMGSVPASIAAVDLIAGLTIAGGAAYFLIRPLVSANRRLLWRVRRKLILSYIFIGFVPALLIITFFLLSGLLLFFSMGSYMLRTRMAAVIDQTRGLAESAALELQGAGGTDDMERILNRRQASAVTQLALASYAAVPAATTCGSARTTGVTLTDPISAGPWGHGDAPRGAPSWMSCEGYAALVVTRTDGPRSSVAARAVARPEGASYFVIVDVPLGDQLARQVRDDTGITLRDLSTLEFGDDATPVSDPERVATGGEAAAPTYKIIIGPANILTEGSPAERLTWVTFTEYTDWDTGEARTLTVSFSLGFAAVWARISGPSLSRLGNFNFGQILIIMLAVVGGLFLVIQASAFAMGLLLARSITGSVHELFGGTERVRGGDFTRRIPIRSRDQLGDLAESFNSMTASIEDLLQQAAEKKRLEEELRIAHEIQMSLLPQGPLAMPGLSATAVCIPAREVGGDYYDFLPLDDHRVGILIADVSGKGTSAALYMAQLKGLILSLSTIHTSPRALLVAANRSIRQHLDARSFITAAYAIVDLRARTMTYARAGHTPLIHVPGAGPRVTGASDEHPARRAHILAPNGMVVGLKIDDGLLFDRLLEEQTIPLTTGDLYVFFTDGISEAMNADDECFGEARLGRLAETHAGLPSEELRGRILDEVTAFVNGAPQHDDMTMVLLKVEDLVRPTAAGPYAELAQELG